MHHLSSSSREALSPFVRLITPESDAPFHLVCMPYGLKGTVKFVDDAGQIHMSWENGSSLALNIHEDTFEKVEAPEKISVILVEPGRYPKLIEIEDTLEAMQSLVEGDIEEYMPFEDEVAIICNDEGKMNGLPLNRAVYSEPENVEMSYPQLKAHFRQAEKERNHTTGYIVFTADSFDKPYTEEQRTYVVSSNNKAFIEGMRRLPRISQPMLRSARDCRFTIPA